MGSDRLNDFPSKTSFGTVLPMLPVNETSGLFFPGDEQLSSHRMAAKQSIHDRRLPPDTTFLRRKIGQSDEITTEVCTAHDETSEDCSRVWVCFLRFSFFFALSCQSNILLAAVDNFTVTWECRRICGLLLWRQHSLECYVTLFKFEWISRLNLPFELVVKKGISLSKQNNILRGLKIKKLAFFDIGKHENAMFHKFFLVTHDLRKLAKYALHFLLGENFHITQILHRVSSWFSVMVSFIVFYDFFRNKYPTGNISNSGSFKKPQSNSTSWLSEVE